MFSEFGKKLFYLELYPMWRKDENIFRCVSAQQFTFSHKIPVTSTRGSSNKDLKRTCGS